MQRLMIALLLLSSAGCGEDPVPPPRKVAPEAPPVAKKQDPVIKPTPPPPPTPQPTPPPPTPAAAAKPVSKVLLDPSLPEWLGAAPPVFKVKVVTTKGDF